MNAPRLLMTTDAVGGVWRYALDLACGLGRLGVETTLLGFGPRPTSAQREEAATCADLFWSDLPLDWMARTPADLAGVPGTVERIARESRADLVQVNVPSQAAGLALGVPIVAAVHSCVTSWFRVVRGTELPADWAWQADLTRAGLATASSIVAPCESFARVLSACHPGTGTIAAVPNASALTKPAVAKQPYAYAAARWWDEGKNADTLDEAARLCGVPIHAAGSTSGPEGQQVTFRYAQTPGQLCRARMVELGAAAQVFVSPSVYEPFGLAALEAARLGAALVLSGIPTYREIWDGAALFAAPDDAEGFATAIDTLSTDHDLRRSLSVRAMARAAHYTLEAQAARMSALYRSLQPGQETVGAA